MSGSLVRQAKSASTPPRSASASPAALASSSRGRMPAAKITTPASMDSPLLRFTRTVVEPSECSTGSIDLVPVPTLIAIPRSEIIRASSAPPASSICWAINRGIISITLLCKPNWLVAGVVVAGKCQQVAVPAFGVGGQPDAVIGRVALLGQHGDPPRRATLAGTVTGAERLDQSVAHHAVPDHHKVAGRGVRAR